VLTISDIYGPPEGSRLKVELDSWAYFEKALRLKDRLRFRKMNEPILQCAKTIEVSPEGFGTETYLLTFLIHQQKLIDLLEQKLKERK